MTSSVNDVSVSSELNARLKAIKLVVFDVDGVLTDGRLYYSPTGEALKVFNVKDGVGIKLLRDCQVQVAIMTAKDSSMVAKRMADLGIEHYFPGVKDKGLQLDALATRQGLDSAQLCFVGDDMVDLPAMAIAGVGICPQDAYSLVRQAADLITPMGGGQGVARYVCDVILQAKGQYESAYQMAMAPQFEKDRTRTT
ncbi:HAD-IIIA family hydrolase [Reinekea sp.]|jgi:3-deoxy-D-manno-octulosonate 8-phosphate phosphatase (KDO 8-P phosphatase)|uniref:KdsC family phosphatase n=1 Tax=Reinekea sp. TaxID=1970455 RepID=UPI002A7EE4CA|nr:HAD-IIIA family hydrolase [Reinekea sp.]